MGLITALEIIDIGFKGDQSIDASHFSDRFIETVELVYIRPYFPQVFDNIIAKNGSGYTALETTLVDKIKYALFLFCKHDIIPELSLNLGNAGVQTYSSEFSNPVSSRERAVLQAQILNHAETEMNSVMRWYEDQDDLTGEETETKKSFTGDVVI